MRFLCSRRSWRLLAAALGLATASAIPATTWAHAAAHARSPEEHHQHVSSLQAHDRPLEVAAPDRAAGHAHADLDAAAPTTKLVPVVALPVGSAIVGGDLALGSRNHVVRAAPVRPPDPTGGAPPQPRGPPVH
jgi:phosphoribosylcarboxyaminoimidazole (NCAIR) mutase